ncbi:MAG: hypothetical protein IT350_03600 [Deltaproteobacteria bacterium]|nr:hypothetical protein [Deltaproteobacteria bacterium]
MTNRATHSAPLSGRAPRAFRWWCVATGILTAVQIALPLVGVPGYEAAEIQTIWFATVAGHLAIAWRRHHAHTPLLASTSASALATAGLWIACVAAVFAAGIARGACDASRDVWWFLVLPAPAIVLGTAWGAFLSSLPMSPRRTHLAYVGIVAAHLAWELVGIRTEAMTFAYNALLGYFPGPVYDRAVRITVTLAASRALALAEATALFALAALIARRRESPPTHSVAPIATLFAGVAATIALAVIGPRLDASTDRAKIDATLGAIARGPNVTMHVPEDTPPDEARLLLIDLEHRFSRQTKWLGLDHPEPVDAYYYRSAREKKRLTGAGDTQWASCWNREMHMTVERPPHTVLKHEVVHVLAEPWGLPGLGFSRVLGITEGLAVASEVWREDWTIPDWAAAMKSVGRLPDLADISGPTGFWRLSGTRSYLAWGGFLTWLRERHSTDALARVYRTGDFSEAFGKSLRELVDEWEVSLDAIAVPPDLGRVAAYRFFRPSLFEGRCARTVGTLEEDGARALEAGRAQKSVRLFGDALDLSGGDSRHRRDLMAALVAARRLDEAEREAAEIFAAEGSEFFATPEPGKPVRGNLLAATQARLTQAALAWRRSDLDAARRLYDDVRSFGMGDGNRREAIVAIYALDTASIEPLLRRYLVEPDAEGARWHDLHAALDARPDAAVVRYLLGRRLFGARRFDDATSHLDAALALDLPDDALTREAWRTLGRAYYEAGRFADAAVVFSERRPANLSEGARLDADEWVDRCLFAAAFPPTIQIDLVGGTGDDD